MVEVVAAAILSKDFEAQKVFGSSGTWVLPALEKLPTALAEALFLIVRRGPQESGAGHWEFPGGKIEAGETKEVALLREIDEELKMPIRIIAELGFTDFAYSQKTLRIHLFLCQSLTNQFKLSDHDLHVWLKPSEFHQLNWAQADLDFMKYFVC